MVSVIVRRTPIRKRFMAMAGRPILFYKYSSGYAGFGRWRQRHFRTMPPKRPGLGRVGYRQVSRAINPHVGGRIPLGVPAPPPGPRRRAPGLGPQAVILGRCPGIGMTFSRTIGFCNERRLLQECPLLSPGYQDNGGTAIRTEAPDCLQRIRKRYSQRRAPRQDVAAGDGGKGCCWGGDVR